MAGKEDQSKALPLSNTEIKLIALGVRFAGENGKMDYEKIAQYGGYTKGSAQVLYRKAHRKLLDAFPIEEEATTDTVPSSSTPKTKERKTAGAAASKKRKIPVVVMENPDFEPLGTMSTPPDAGIDVDAVTPITDGTGGNATEARTPSKSPVKRQRKSPVKKTPTAEPVKKEEYDSDDQDDIIKSESNYHSFTTATP